MDKLLGKRMVGVVGVEFCLLSDSRKLEWERPW